MAAAFPAGATTLYVDGVGTSPETFATIRHALQYLGSAGLGVDGVSDEISIVTNRLTEFLGPMLNGSPGTVTIAGGHSSDKVNAAVRDFAQHRRRVHLIALSTYAPEINPVEGLWAHCKAQTLAHASPRNIGDLVERVSQANTQVWPKRLHGFIRRARLALWIAFHIQQIRSLTGHTNTNMELPASRYSCSAASWIIGQVASS